MQTGIQRKLIEEHFLEKRPLFQLAKELERDYSLLWRERRSLTKKCVALSKILEHFKIPVNVIMGMFELTDKLTKRHKGKIHSIVLFGSYVRGDYTASSDVDVVLIVEKKIPDLDKLAINLSKKYAASFSPLQLPLDRFREEMKDESMLLLNLSINGIIFYDDGTFRRNMLTKPSAKTIRSCVARAKEKYSELKGALATLGEDETLVDFVGDFGYLIGLQLSQALLLMKNIIPESKYVVFNELKKQYPELGGEARILTRCMQHWDGAPAKLSAKNEILAALDKLMGLCEDAISEIGA